MAQVVYILCGLTSVTCALLLYRQYRARRSGLLFWATFCFICLVATNILLYVDLVILPALDLSVVRSSVTLAGFMMLLYGMIKESTR